MEKFTDTKLESCVEKPHFFLELVTDFRKVNVFYAGYTKFFFPEKTITGYMFNRIVLGGGRYVNIMFQQDGTPIIFFIWIFKYTLMMYFREVGSAEP